MSQFFGVRLSAVKQPSFRVACLNSACSCFNRHERGMPLRLVTTTISVVVVTTMARGPKIPSERLAMEAAGYGVRPRKQNEGATICCEPGKTN